MEEKQNGPGGKVKSKKPKQLEVEETCIVDKLMDEIRNGFPLKKRKVSKPASPVVTLTEQSRKLSRERAKMSIRRASLFASSLCMSSLFLHFILICVIFVSVRVATRYFANSP